MATDTQDLFKKHLEKMSQAQFIPETPYDHAFALLQGDKKEFKSFLDMHSQLSLLSNIGSDRLMAIFQDEMFFHSQFFDMGMKDSEVLGFFELLFATFLNQLSLTRARDGLERKLQVFSGQTASSSGFGSEIEKELVRRQQEQQRKGGIDFYG